MPYVPNVPARNDQLQDSQPTFLGNFTEIFDVWSTEHVEFDDINQGKHIKTTLVNSNVFANLIPNVNNREVVWGCQQNDVSNKRELGVKRNGSSISMITSNYNDNPDNFNNILQQTILPSGIMIRHGTASFNNAFGERRIDYAVAFGYQPFTTVYNVIVSPRVFGSASTNVAVHLSSFNNLSCTVFITPRTGTNNQNPSTLGVNVIVIGVP